MREGLAGFRANRYCRLSRPVETRLHQQYFMERNLIFKLISITLIRVNRSETLSYNISMKSFTILQIQVARLPQPVGYKYSDTLQGEGTVQLILHKTSLHFLIEFNCAG